MATIVKMSDDFFKPLGDLLGLDFLIDQEVTLILRVGEAAVIERRGFIGDSPDGPSAEPKTRDGGVIFTNETDDPPEGDEDGEDEGGSNGPSAEPEAGGGSSTPAP